MTLDGFFGCMTGGLKNCQTNKGEIVVLLWINGGDVATTKVCIIGGCYDKAPPVRGNDDVPSKVERV